MLFRVRDIDEAIALANDTPFGLARLGVDTQPGRAARFARNCNAAPSSSTTVVASDPRLPFGGIKHSGYGRELSAAGMREFLNAKTVVIAEPIVADRAAEKTSGPRAFERRLVSRVRTRRQIDQTQTKRRGQIQPRPILRIAMLVRS